MTLVFKKIGSFFAENLLNSLKIVFITLSPVFNMRDNIAKVSFVHYFVDN
jgi:hypothetical protein